MNGFSPRKKKKKSRSFLLLELKRWLFILAIFLLPRIEKMSSDSVVHVLLKHNFVCKFMNLKTEPCHQISVLYLSIISAPSSVKEIYELVKLK